MLFQVVPWPPISLDMGIDPSAEQRAVPRLFKSHQRLSAINRGAR